MYTLHQSAVGSFMHCLQIRSLQKILLSSGLSNAPGKLGAGCRTMASLPTGKPVLLIPVSPRSSELQAPACCRERGSVLPSRATPDSRYTHSPQSLLKTYLHSLLTLLDTWLTFLFRGKNKQKKMVLGKSTTEPENHIILDF